ncbi:hypothetical protein D3C77_382510 [compost metagenome]
MAGAGRAQSLRHHIVLYSNWQAEQEAQSFAANQLIIQARCFCACAFLVQRQKGADPLISFSDLGKSFANQIGNR